YTSHGQCSRDRSAFPSMTNPRSIPKTNSPWLPPGHRTSDAVRTAISALVASHLARLHHQVGVGLALPFLVRRQCTRRGRQAVPLLRKALRTSRSGVVAQGPRSGPFAPLRAGSAAPPAARALAAPQIGQSALGLAAR